MIELREIHRAQCSGCGARSSYRPLAEAPAGWGRDDHGRYFCPGCYCQACEQPADDACPACGHDE